MAPSTSPSVSDRADDFFNQPVHRPKQKQTARDNTDNEENNDIQSTNANNESVPRPKRIACVLCRKRKLKCDGNKPSCGTCSRLGHQCEYDEVRKKSGPKRGYVKHLEARLKQVENLLENRDVVETNTPNSNSNSGSDKQVPSGDVAPNFDDTSMQGVVPDPSFTDPSLNIMQDFGVSSSDDFSWEMIGLGLEEALPNQDVIDELHQIYFEKIHPSIPMIQRARFLASMDLAPHMRPAVCLRYAMWTLACSVTTKYSAYAEHFYARARKYAEQDEMRGQGESMITLAHTQCWVLIATHEFKHMYFPRAWMSIGRASRLCLMMGLNRQDRVGLDVKQTLLPPRDWTEREERRRTFWICYINDRYASIGTGWPMTFDEQDILTNLPANEDAFNKCQPEPTLQLSDVLSGDGAASVSTLGAVIVLATVYGRNLHHLHRPHERDHDHDLNGEFWKRHRALDNLLLNISLSLPNHIRMPAGISEPNAVFVNMNLHTATICLHQAAIFKADKNHLPAQISAESKRRCVVAADQITNIMKMISHLDLSVMNPFLAFCLYIAARVFVQYLKSKSEDGAVKSSLHFLLSAMQVLKQKNPLTESFLVQLDIDLEGSGLDLPNSTSRFRFGHRPPGEVPANTDSVNCSPLYEIRQTQVGVNEGTPNNSANWHNDQPQNKSSSSTTQSDLYDNVHGFRSFKAQPSTRVAMPSFEGAGNPYNSTQPGMASEISPEYFNGDSGQSSNQHSNGHTPSTTSNRTPSHTFASPQNSGITYSNAANDQAHQYIFNPADTGSNLPGANPANVASNWNLSNGDGVGNPRDPINEQQQPDLSFGLSGMTPGATGMTPLPDSVWSMTENNDWIFGWPGSTPQPQ